MEPESKGLKELKKEVYALLLEKFSDITREPDFRERFDDINQRMYKKYGCVITDMITGFVAKTSKVEAASENQAVLKPSTFPVKVGMEDKEFLSALKIDSTEEELGELRKDLISARIESRAKSWQKLLPGPQTRSTNNPRTVGMIINDIRTIARKLDQNSRRAAAKRINIEMGMFIPVADQLALLNDTFWLQQIQATINRIRELAGAKDKIKALLLSLEVIIKSGGAES